MIRTFNDLKERPIHAVDGELGKVCDVYFDDRSWRIRYLVAELGSWFKSKRVLISPLALAEFDGVSLGVHLTKQEIADCPDSDSDKPVYLQEKERIEALYSMVQSFNTTGGLGMVLPFVPPSIGDEVRMVGNGNRYLRSSRMVSRYSLCTDGEKVGLARDFLIDDRSWTIKYVVFVRSGRPQAEEHLCDTGNITGIEWDEECLNLESSGNAFSGCPAFDRDRHVNISSEDLLHLLDAARRSKEDLSRGRS